MRYLKKGEIIRGSDEYYAWNGKDKSSLHWTTFESGYQGGTGERVGETVSKVRRPSLKLVATHSTSPNKSSIKFPLLEVLEEYFKRYRKSCYCDYDNEVGASSFITFIRKHHT